MSQMTSRQSGVPGLVIWGSPGWYQIWSQPVADGPSVSVLARHPNKFSTVRDAKAAAARMSSLLPWTDDQAIKQAIADIGHDELQYLLLEALTSMTRQEIQDHDDAAREASRVEYNGTGARDGFDRTLRAGGHYVNWQRKGQRTFWGTCANCGGEFRSSYRSMSKSYQRSYSSGVGDTCTNPTT